MMPANEDDLSGVDRGMQDLLLETFDAIMVIREVTVDGDLGVIETLQGLH